jgi:D-sedoheptulose 7-phosphate isomerase
MRARTGRAGAGPSPDAREWIRAAQRAHAEAAERFFGESSDKVAEVAGVLARALRAGRTIFFFGNGGSAADAQHLAAEFVNRFSADRPALAALALTTDTSVLTSVGNDSAFSRIFARQVEALGRRGDVAVGLSTSGRSPNILEGLGAARDRGLVTVGFTGADGGEMAGLCRHLIRVPSRETPRIQEVHILVGHILCGLVDATLFPPK